MGAGVEVGVEEIVEVEAATISATTLVVEVVSEIVLEHICCNKKIDNTSYYLTDCACQILDILDTCFI